MHEEGQAQGQQAQTQRASRGGSRRGTRRGRGGRGRGQGDGASRGGRDGDAAAAAAESNAAAESTTAISASSDPTSAPPASSRGRNRRRGQQPSSRGSDAPISFRTGPQRRFGGHLTSETREETRQAPSEDGPSTSTPPSLSVNAPEFVPGQIVATTRTTNVESAVMKSPEIPPSGTAAFAGTSCTSSVRMTGGRHPTTSTLKVFLFGAALDATHSCLSGHRASIAGAAAGTAQAKPGLCYHRTLVGRAVPSRDQPVNTHARFNVTRALVRHVVL
ncbi:hypothetical protein G7046_g3469 [Stylonectria norvegica]|nr:hypothetical protein G7046_g3469 [Stylonectria norvegica]